VPAGSSVASRPVPLDASTKETKLDTGTQSTGQSAHEQCRLRTVCNSRVRYKDGKLKGRKAAQRERDCRSPLFLYLGANGTD
jgi:hypothetical protein